MSKEKDKWEKVGTFTNSINYWHIEAKKKVDYHIKWRDTESISEVAPDTCIDITEQGHSVDEDVFLIYRQFMLLSGHCPIYSFIRDSNELDDWELLPGDDLYTFEWNAGHRD